MKTRVKKWIAPNQSHRGIPREERRPLKTMHTRPMTRMSPAGTGAAGRKKEIVRH